ncbi:hypothetical protein [Rhodanobacter lindaniclasticus]
MGLLAWAMLVVNALAAAPMGMTGGPHLHATQAAIAAAGEHGHHHAAVKASQSGCGDQAGCCDGMDGHTCQCAAMCSTTMPPAMVVVPTAIAMTTSYATPLPGSAPSLNTAPPLRPPAA